jgi:valyl-tRNA synthetase
MARAPRRAAECGPNSMLEKTFEAASVEPRIAARWDEAGAFKAGAGKRPDGQAFSIVIPPPNVTGNLHMGHALNNTLQDVLARWKRMQGYDVLWQPGTDHAGIATQMVVERQLQQTQQPGRRDLGREKFLEKVWAWKAESGGAIVNQLKRLGASCDWSRERFTMDEGLSKAVLKVFVALYNKGLIYKDKRLVNWDPQFETAISDLEVIPVEIKGNLWHFRYPIEGMPGRYITVATTRPETMLGDTAVAVNPKDERYADVVGKYAILPLVGRRIPIVADEYSDMEKGTGAVKITPAHDFNDFEVGRRHQLAMISVLDRKALVALKGNVAFLDGIGVPCGGGAPEPKEGEEPAPALAYTMMTDELVGLLDGVDRFEARKIVVKLMEARGLLAKIEPNTHMVPHGDRSNVVIEPFLTDQWYVNAGELAKPARAGVADGRMRFVPKQWENTFYQWMDNIQPWCISRQLWWGHQIPAWYGADGKVFVAETEAEAKAAAAAYYGAETPLIRDEDVLDTWFSSALWPFSTMGWPDQTEELKRYYPTSVLITGFDIIFFWVARMMMMGLEFMDGEIPFHDIYMHALVRDEKGAKMSKSKGNVIDPLVLIDEYGADALRFTLTAMAAQGRDIKLSLKRVEGYKAFSNKLWNAARFTQMNECKLVEGFDPAGAQLTVNRWILAALSNAVADVDKALTEYKFNDAAGSAYRFVWNNFCDWYLELAKPIFQGDDEAQKAETRATCAYVLDQILKLLHPFMPFITEELWAEAASFSGTTRAAPLVLTEWPTPAFQAADAYAEIEWLVALVSAVRSVRTEMNIPPATLVPLVMVGAGEVTRARVATHEAAIRRLARISDISFADAAPAASAQLVAADGLACLPLEGLIDFAAERARLEKEKKKLDDEVKRIDVKLGNEAFVAKAPEEVIEGEKEKREDYVERRAKVEEALARLG